jgi:hypothetical protein
MRGGRVSKKGRGREDRCGCRSVKAEDDELVYTGSEVKEQRKKAEAWIGPAF